MRKKNVYQNSYLPTVVKDKIVKLLTITFYLMCGKKQARLEIRGKTKVSLRFSSVVSYNYIIH